MKLPRPVPRPPARRTGNSLETRAVIRTASFRAALRSYLRRSERVARGNGLTPQRYLLLLMIKGAPDGSERATVTELTDRLQLAQSTVTELVRRSEEAGLVERAPSRTDARMAHLSLTPEGERRLEESFANLETERAQLQQAFAASDAEAHDERENPGGAGTRHREPRSAATRPRRVASHAARATARKAREQTRNASSCSTEATHQQASAYIPSGKTAPHPPG